MRHSAIMGSVVVLHLATLALVLLPPPYRSKHTSIRHGDVALRIRFVRAPEPSKPPPAPVSPTSRHRPPSSVPVTAQAIPSTALLPTPPATATELVLSLPASTPGDVTYRPGDFHAALRNAQRSPPSQLPGATGPALVGIHVRTPPSPQVTVRAMTLASRCAATKIKLARSTTEAITPQLMDRLLEAGGCGPQPARTANDALIEAVSHQAIFGD